MWACAAGAVQGGIHVFTPCGHVQQGLSRCRLYPCGHVQQGLSIRVESSLAVFTQHAHVQQGLSSVASVMYLGPTLMDPELPGSARELPGSARKFPPFSLQNFY